LRVVLLHALPLDGRMWEPQHEALSGFEIVTPRLYDLGSTLEQWADGLLAQLEGRLAVVGSSMGGYCALALARRAPDRIAGVALVCSRADADPPERRPVREEWIRLAREEGAAGLWKALRESVFASVDSDVADRLEPIALAQEPEGLVRAVTAIRDRPDARDVVAGLAAPFLVVVGEHDPLLPVADAEEMAASAPDGRAAAVAGTGHLPSFERPAEFNPVLLDFLASL
jgi:pimeloyl-ACP methyl ester carboxylesterase